jgi:hypothetical protein
MNFSISLPESDDSTIKARIPLTAQARRRTFAVFSGVIGKEGVVCECGEIKDIMQNLYA